MGDKDREPDPWKRDVKKHSDSNGGSKSSKSVGRSAKTGRYVKNPGGESKTRDNDSGSKNETKGKDTK